MAIEMVVSSGTGAGCGRALPGGFSCRHPMEDHADMHEGLAFSVVIECAHCAADAMGWHNAHLPCPECSRPPRTCRASEEHYAFATHPFESPTVTIHVAAARTEKQGGVS